MATFFSDLHAKMVGGESIAPVVVAASTTVNGASVDMLTGDGPVFGYSTIGTVSASTTTQALKLQESADGSTAWTDIASGAFTGTTEGNATGSVWITSQFRTKRYVRAVAAIFGTSVTSVPLHVSCFSMKKVLGNSGTIL